MRPAARILLAAMPLVPVTAARAADAPRPTPRRPVVVAVWTPPPPAKPPPPATPPLAAKAPPAATAPRPAAAPSVAPEFGRGGFALWPRDLGRWFRGAVEPTRYDDLIRQTAARYGLEYALVKAVVKAESDFDTRAVSPKGALGLMQLMPQTAALHGVRNPFFPPDNVDGGCRHLRMLLDRYAGNLPLAIAAYNAGEQRVEEAGGVPAIPETREYLARVLQYRLAYLTAR